MKKLIITMSIALISILGYSQVTSVGEFRVATATTDFGVNLPIGTKVYNIATGDYWVATAGVGSDEDLTSASASFTKLNDSGTDDQTATEVGVTATGNLTSTNVQSALAELQGDIDGISSAGYLTSEVDGSITNEIQTIDTARLVGTTLELSLSNDEEAKKQIDLSSLQDGTGTDDQGLSYNSDTHAIDIEDGSSAVIPFASSSNAGLLTAAKFDEITANTLKETNVNTDLSLGTVTTTSMNVNSSDGDDVTLTAATASAAGVMTAAQVTKLEGIDAGAEVNLTMVTEKFEEDDGTATPHSLSHTAITSQGCIVSINGVTLAPAKYALTTTTITVSVPVYQYDQIVITYNY